VGNKAELVFKPGETVAYDPRKTFEIKPSQFDREFRPGTRIEPRTGRFYPKGILKGIANVFKENVEPFRCTGVQNDKIGVDFNHPLAEKELHLTAVIRGARNKPGDRGGSCTDWMETVTSGPGMQARWGKTPTDFFSDDPFARADEESDDRFYTSPRFVNHLDDTAIEGITDIYRKYLRPGMKVLDLMSSWKSHLPEDIKLAEVTGLGLNAAELEKNPQLSRYTVHDLNENSELPYQDESFDAVICTASVEYLIRPFDVFEDIHRVLKPGGAFVVTFSNRWFPPKAIKIWQELHEFERVGLVLEYFLRSGTYREMETYSMRGVPRPVHDKYYSEQIFSDPVFSVSGVKTPEKP
jgi:SAM-dependent methyltransferase